MNAMWLILAKLAAVVYTVSVVLAIPYLSVSEATLARRVRRTMRLH